MSSPLSRRARLIARTVGSALLLGCSAWWPPRAAAAAPTPFQTFADRYFSALYGAAPTQGTAAGFHQYDARLEDLSAGAFRDRADTLHRLLAGLDSLRAGSLSADDRIDAAMIDGAIRSELLEIETIQGWRHNPMMYVGLPGAAIDGLMKRNFAPPAERLRSATARLRRIPAVLEAMRANIVDPPKEFTDLAIRMAGGSVGFFREAVAGWGRGAAGGDTVLLRAFVAANDSAA